MAQDPDFGLYSGVIADDQAEKVAHDLGLYSFRTQRIVPNMSLDRIRCMIRQITWAPAWTAFMIISS
ncbi:MAG: hypothetical protein L0Y72_15525 [Gemmataceae bacterium]|nr:hypothetical protein [Gemmataceae bacterium]MCI0740456.1 hypothetical protein [Gemmataceae bacterium]